MSRSSPLWRDPGLGHAEEGAPSSAIHLRSTRRSVDRPAGRSGGLIIRAKCAPFFRRILYTLDAKSPLLQNYAHGSCPAGKAYCRIMPEGDVTPCPYMPLVAGICASAPSSTSGSRLRCWKTCVTQLGGRCGA